MSENTEPIPSFWRRRGKFNRESIRVFLEKQLSA
jgi:hypothetical protein